MLLELYRELTLKLTFYYEIIISQYYGLCLVLCCRVHSVASVVAWLAPI